MTLAIAKLRGMTKELEAKLKAQGLKSADDLFNALVTPKARQELAALLGVPENLHAKLLEINAAKNLTAQPPSLKMVATWVSLARKRRKFLLY